jgi:hypothetical protein
MECVILVDNSNIFIEDAKHSARLKGVKPRPLKASSAAFTRAIRRDLH